MLKISLYDLQRRFWASSCVIVLEILKFLTCFHDFFALMLGGIVSIMYDFSNCDFSLQI